MKPEYMPKTLKQKIGYVIEEFGEVLSALGKTLRWGLESPNPELPPEKQITNRTWVWNELNDFSVAIMILLEHFEELKCQKSTEKLSQ